MEDEKSHVRRELEETASLLKEVARRHMQMERPKGGAPTAVIGAILICCYYLS
jgi:hypothetical protein